MNDGGHNNIRERQDKNHKQEHQKYKPENQKL